MSTEGVGSVVIDEWTVVGPPGTGKTTWLVRQARAAVESRRGSGDVLDRPPEGEGDGVLISSLTRAAAREVLDPKRGAPLDSRSVGTLHAHAWRALGCPELVIARRSHLAAWNEANPDLAVSSFGGEKSTDDDDQAAAVDTDHGDSLLAEYHLMRARLRPRELWAADLLEFADAYERWKFETDLVDFSDVIERAYLLVDAAPGDPRIIFVDEAQDHDRSELRLVRKWARRADRLIVIGDPDQCIYEWRGADPAEFWGDDIPDDHRRTLSQSYRVPRAVHAAAVGMIGRIADRRPVEYLPRDADGEVSSAWSITGVVSEYAVRDAAEHVKAGRTVMFLATCQYMLAGLAAALRAEGLAYWNPFAPKNGFFNPLHPQSGKSIVRRLLSFLRVRDDLFGESARLWTAGDLHDWLDLCNSTGLLKRGATKRIGKWEAGYTPTRDEFRELFDSEAVLAEIATADPRVLANWARPAKQKNLEFAIAAYQACGLGALTDEPRAILGTIHSVKGGEADVVYVSPDLSMNGYEHYVGDGEDATHRMFYVAMTRAREHLVLCEPSGGRGIDW